MDDPSHRLTVFSARSMVSWLCETPEATVSTERDGRFIGGRYGRRYSCPAGASSTWTLLAVGSGVFSLVDHAHVSSQVVESVKRHLTDGTLMELQVLVDETVPLERVLRFESHVTVGAL